LVGYNHPRERGTSLYKNVGVESLGVNYIVA